MDSRHEFQTFSSTPQMGFRDLNQYDNSPRENQFVMELENETV